MKFPSTFFFLLKDLLLVCYNLNLVHLYFLIDGVNFIIHIQQEIN